MKIIFRSAAIVALFIATSCGKDAPENVAEEFEKEAEQQEQTPLEANSVSDNVIIEGGTKKDGVPPTPNEGITLDVSSTSKTAFLGEGFDVSVSSNVELAGAYIQFKSEDGTVSDSYYDIDISANSKSSKITASKKGFNFDKKNKGALVAKNDEATVIDVDFNVNIEPGTFCYVVCVYDAEGNISGPSEVCATVESWGGYAELVAEWNNVKSEETYDGQTSVTVLGEEDCMSFESGFLSTTCNQEFTSFFECETTEIAKLTLKADGTYSYNDQSKRQVLDTAATEEACEAVYKDALRTYGYESLGNWAYVKGESRLTLVEYSWSDTEDGVLSESETYDPGEGELIFDGKITVDGNAFIVMEEYDDDNDGIIDLLYKTYFEK